MKIEIEDVNGQMEVRADGKDSPATLVGTLMMAVFGILSDTQNSNINMVDLEKAVVKVLDALAQGKLNKFAEKVIEEEGDGDGKEKNEHGER